MSRYDTRMQSVIAMALDSRLLASALTSRQGQGWPELPALSALLHHAQRLPDANWHRGVMTALELAAADCLPVQMAAQALPSVSPGAGICLALPVHVVAGISRMFLGEPQAVTPDEQESLRLAFNAEFGSAQVGLHAVGSGWLLQAPFASAADDDSPENLLGVALAREPAVTPAARSLRRLGAEVEIWLSSLPLNRIREQRGQSPINSFWFWGGGVAAELPQAMVQARRFCSNAPPDAWMAGLAAHMGTTVQCDAGWSKQCEGALVLLHSSQRQSWDEQLAEWDSAWLAPAWRDVQGRRLHGLRLQLGQTVWQLPAARWRRWLRRARPWWQQLATGATA